jgi:hypothetical protein
VQLFEKNGFPIIPKAFGTGMTAMKKTFCDVVKIGSTDIEKKGHGTSPCPFFMPVQKI